MSKTRLLSLLYLAASFALPNPGTADGQSQAIQCWVRMPDPNTHLYHVELHVCGLSGKYADFKMPVWIPGSYLVREFERNVEGFAAEDTDGRALPWHKVRKNTWRVRLSGSEVRIRYRVYAFELSVRTSYLGAERGFLNPSSVIMFVKGQLDRPYVLHLQPPGDWRTISTGLDSLPGKPFTRLAHDYDELVDCPILLGNHTRLFFRVQDVPHEVAISGRGPFCADSVLARVPQIVQETVKIFGSFPYKRYVFLTLLSEKGGGGLEHRNSCALLVNRFALAPKDGLRSFLPLVSHEFFHAWNVKAIRPEPLGPFDYDRENYTTLLWLAEGFTTYYSGQVRLRLGWTKPAAYLRGLARQISDYLSNPGRFVQSLEMASYDAWIKYYRPDENSPNVTQSYYSGGALFATLLDLSIRHYSGTEHSLDDVMRTLYERFGKDGRNVTERDLRRLCEHFAGKRLDSLFTFVRRTTDFALEPYLALAGLELQPDSSKTRAALGPYFGADLTVQQNGSVVVRSVRRDSPAERGGVYARDELLALDGYRVTGSEVNQILGNYAPGDSISVLVSREGLVRRLTVVLGRSPLLRFKLAPVAKPTTLQEEVCKGWLHCEVCPK